MTRSVVLSALLLLIAPSCRPAADGSDSPAYGHDTSTGEDTSGPLDPGDVRLELHPDIESLVYVSWLQEEAATVRVEVRFDGGDWQAAPEREREAGEQTQLVIGVPYETEFEARVVLTRADGTTETWGPVTGETGPLPDGLPVPELLAADEERWEPTGRYLLGSINQDGGGWNGGTYWKFIVDRQARVVWAHVTPDQHWSIYLRVPKTGEGILWDEATYWADWSDRGQSSVVHRMTLDGTVLETISTPGLHHPFTDLPDGSLAWGAADWRDSGSGWGDESLVVRDAATGEVAEVWNCEEFQREIGASQYYCQSNTLFYDEDADTFLYSFYSSNSIIEIERSTGEVTHVWGHWPGAWDFDPPASAFWWQHGVTRLDNGHILTSTYRSEGDDELVAREYEVDEANEVLHEVWSFGEGEGVHGSTAGEAHRLPGGNTLHNYGAGSRVREVTPEGDVVWDVSWGDNGRLLGRTVFLDDLYDYLEPSDD